MPVQKNDPCILAHIVGKALKPLKQVLLCKLTK